MAQSTALFDETGSDSFQVLQAVGGDVLTVPGDAWLLKADFAPQGGDLLLTGPDGSQVLIRDFFNLQTPPDLITDTGAIIPAELAVKLAGPAAPGQFALLENGPFAEIAQADESIGRVEATDGLVEAIRADGTTVSLAKGDDIFQGDTLVTGEGAAIGITFADDTTFSLGEEGRMVIDEMVYDPATQEGAFSANLVQGVFSFVSGEIAKTGPDAMTVTTPVATIGIRGTKVAGRAAQEGAENTISLLPETDAQGVQSVGELSVTNQGGTVTLSSVGATVQMTSALAAPPSPVVFSPEQIQQNFGSTLTTLSTTAAAKASADAAENAEQAQQAEADAEQAGEEAQAAEAEAEAAAAEAEAAAEEAEAAAAEAEAAIAEAEAAGDEEALAEAEAMAAEAEALAAEAENKAAEAEMQAAEAETAQAEAEQAQAEAEQAQAEAEQAEAEAEHFNNEMQAQAEAFEQFGGPPPPDADAEQAEEEAARAEQEATLAEEEAQFAEEEARFAQEMAEEEALFAQQIAEEETQLVAQEMFFGGLDPFSDEVGDGMYLDWLVNETNVLADPFSVEAEFYFLQDQAYMESNYELDNAHYFQSFEDQTTSAFVEVLSATSGNDALVGGDGNTQFKMSQTGTVTLGGTDTVNGGGGTDEITLENLDGFQLVFNMSTNVATYSNGATSPTIYGTIQFSSIEQVYASDAEVANPPRLNLDNSTGYGYIIAGTNQASGVETLDVRNDVILSNLTYFGAADATTNGYKITDAEVKGSIVFGKDGVDHIYGSSAGDTIYGGRGNDIIYGNGGEDTLKGGPGTDTYVITSTQFTSSSGGKIADDDGDGVIQMDASHDFTYSGTVISAIPRLEWTGAATATVTGLQVDWNSWGFSTLIADTNSNQLDIIATTDVATNLSLITFTNWGSSGTDTINYTGTVYADTFTGSTNAETVIGGDGGDTLTGGGGANIFKYTATTDGASAGSVAGYDTITDFVTTNDKFTLADALDLALDDITANTSLTFVADGAADFTSTHEGLLLTSSATSSYGVTDAALTTLTFGNVLSAINANLSKSASGDDALIAVQGSTDTGIYYFLENGDTPDNADYMELSLLALVDNQLLAAGDFTA